MEETNVNYAYDYSCTCDDTRDCDDTRGYDCSCDYTRKIQ
jgi:hypothetical protein